MKTNINIDLDGMVKGFMTHSVHLKNTENEQYGKHNGRKDALTDKKRRTTPEMSLYRHCDHMENLPCFEKSTP